MDKRRKIAVIGGVLVVVSALVYLFRDIILFLAVGIYVLFAYWANMLMDDFSAPGPGCDKGSYVEYKPIVADLRKIGADVFSIDESIATDEHHDGVRFAFDRYGIDYKEVDGKIFLVCEVWGDKDYIWNITMKADDKEWIERESYREYKPRFINRSKRPNATKYMVDKSRVDSEHYENVKFVLEQKKIKFKVVDGEVMMDWRVVRDDKDTMANITRLANDKDWLKARGIDEWKAERKKGYVTRG